MARRHHPLYYPLSAILVFPILALPIAVLFFCIFSVVCVASVGLSYVLRFLLHMP